MALSSADPDCCPVEPAPRAPLGGCQRTRERARQRRPNSRYTQQGDHVDLLPTDANLAFGRGRPRHARHPRHARGPAARSAGAVMGGFPSGGSTRSRVSAFQAQDLSEFSGTARSTQGVDRPKIHLIGRSVPTSIAPCLGTAGLETPGLERAEDGRGRVLRRSPVLFLAPWQRAGMGGA